ncbi:MULTISPECIES: hypothetical protein [Martelella]|uniref:Uncharacterized protein n=1 Tax=Martelella radicis TaxID=1397476 RepID=A0A7W6KKN5_9HYPH|nr:MULTISPECIES: hypothetical protein [Martelella]MBB4122790.1 hypothetical protein [Martelella radicis]
MRIIDRKSAAVSFRPFVLQDRKRLPSRFFAMISGALNARLS